MISGSDARSIGTDILLHLQDDARVRNHAGRDDRTPLGLKRGTVALQPFNTGWTARAHEEIAEVRRALDALALDVQHVGSTAVPDLVSKPIIDIAVALAEPIDEGDIARRLSETGYVFRGDLGREGGLLFVRTDENEVRAVHVHVVAGTSIEWRNYLEFRDLLRRDSNTRGAYERVKRDAAARFADDRASYTAAKHDFMRNTLADG
jgi:GrpB-like predicted nucleotidyltransferase (UPF0157 family)